jgi:hypothetical protein
MNRFWIVKTPIKGYDEYVIDISLKLLVQGSTGFPRSFVLLLDSEGGSDVDQIFVPGYGIELPLRCQGGNAGRSGGESLGTRSG